MAAGSGSPRPVKILDSGESDYRGENQDNGDNNEGFKNSPAFITIPASWHNALFLFHINLPYIENNGNINCNTIINTIIPTTMIKHGSRRLISLSVMRSALS